MEEEAKLKAEMEREARIEEATKRSEERAIAREDVKYNRLRTDTLADRESQYAQDYIVKGEDAQRRADEEIAKENRAQKRENDPTTIDYKIKAQQLESAKQSVKASQSTVENQDIARQVANLELANKQEISNLRNQLKTEPDKTQQDKIYNRLLILEGKSTKPSFETIDVPIYDDKGEQVKDENTGVPKFRKQLISINPVSQEIKKIGEDSAARYNLEDAKAIAIAEANDRFGKRNTTFFDTEGDKDNSKEYDAFVKARTSVWVSQEKAKDGMLNSKGADLTDASKVETGKVSKTESLIKTANPVEQKQLDSLFNVIKAGESGGKGVDAGTPKPTPDNPNPSASGTFQIIDANLKSHGIKPELPNGKYSAAQKDAFAPTFYKEVYEKTGGNQAAMVAAGFGQEDVYQAIAKAKAKGSNSWWDYLNPSGGVENNMSIIKNRIKQQQQYLIKNDIPVPVSISDFRLNNK